MAREGEFPSARRKDGVAWPHKEDRLLAPYLAPEGPFEPEPEPEPVRAWTEADAHRAQLHERALASLKHALAVIQSAPPTN